MTSPVLCLTHRVPYPPNKGDRIRNWHVLRFLAKRAEVWLACLADERVPAETRRVLEEIATKVTIIPIGRGRWLRAFAGLIAGRSISEGAYSSPDLRRLLREWATPTRFAAAIVSASSLAPYLLMPELKS